MVHNIRSNRVQPLYGAQPVPCVHASATDVTRVHVRDALVDHR